MQVIDDITAPNGKLYIGTGLTGRSNDAGRADSSLLARDFTAGERRALKIRKGILWEAETASAQEVNLQAVECVGASRSRDPAIGDNPWPQFKGEA